MLLRALLIALACLLAATSVCSATVIVLFQGQKQIAIAAESRTRFLDDGYVDNKCKIAIIDNSIVVAFFGTTDGDGKVDVTSLARVAAKHERTLSKVANSWAVDASNWIRGFDPTILSRLVKPDHGVSRAIFAKKSGSGDAIEVVLASVNYDGHIVTPSTEEISAPTEGFAERAYGEYAIFEEFFVSRNTERARVEMKRMQEEKFTPESRAIRTVELTIQYSQTDGPVGGPIDAVVLDLNGIRWVQRKPNCAE